MRQPLYLLLLVFALPLVLPAQTSMVTFGKNRVQHHRDFDEWMRYESDNFVTYWYGEGRNIGQSVVQIAEYDFSYIQTILEHRINEKLQIIVYVDLTDLKQSNIGSEEAFTNVAGQTKIAGNKIFLYFNGDHNDLRRQIREGIASVYLESMLFGSNLQEIVQNAVLLNLPDWFKTGLISYVGQTWSTELDGELRRLLTTAPDQSFEALAEEHPNLLGHSFWYFVAETYGLSTLSNLLYLTRINRSVESGFLYVLGTPYQTTLNDWKNFFQRRYAADMQGREEVTGAAIEIRNKREVPLTQLHLSPDGQRIIYVLNEIGRYKVYMQDLNTGDREVIHKGGFRNAIQATDYNYPLLAWNPSGQEISILYEHRDIPRLIRYNLLEDKSLEEPLGTEYHRVYSMAYVNPSVLVFSATVQGFSDIFLYYPATRQSQRITTDFWDDLDATPVRVGDRSGILFASNRTDSILAPSRLDTVLPINTYDLFYYDLENKPGELVRVTNTPLANERSPAAVDTTFFTYLSDRSGIFNREVGYLEDYVHHYEQEITFKDGAQITLHADSTLAELDSTQVDTIIVYPIIKERAIVRAASNFDRNLTYQRSAPRVNKVLEYFPSPDGDYHVQVSRLETDAIQPPRLTEFQSDRRSILSAADQLLEAPAPAPEPDTTEPARQVLEMVEEITVLPEALPAEKQDTSQAIDIDNYLFQSEFSDEEVVERPAAVAPEPPSPIEDVVTMVPRPRPAGGSRWRKSSPTPTVYRFRPGLIVPYRVAFRTDYVTFNVDNNLLFEGLDSYAANPDGFNTQPLSMLLKGNFKDLFEDHVVEGGLRLPTTFNGTEYFLVYYNRKRRLDKFFAAYRRNQRFPEEGGSFVSWRRENNIVLGQFGVRYPLDIFRSLRATSTLRRDRVQYQATDQTALEEAPAPDITQRAGIRLEYVFDNTLETGLNLRNGTRYKVYTEFFKSFNLEVANGFRFDFNRGFMGLAGFDFRHYQRLDKRSILAFRAAGAVSFGQDRILFYLGGTDNWLLPRFNQNIPTPPEQPGFVTLANNLRGFDLNIRNGNSYALINTELRVPIFRYFSDRIRSPFFRTFQLVGFFDAGTAWSGEDPYSDENPLNTSTFPSATNDPTVTGPPSVEVKVVYFRDPLVFGYGVGARAQLFGYLLRVDYAWGIETRNVLDPKLHISLGLDF